MHRNGGFLLVTAIVILVVLSVLALVLTSLSVTNDSAADQDVRGAQALYIADAGLSEASFDLLSPTVYDTASADDRRSCGALAAGLTGVPVGAGAFSVTNGTVYASGATSPVVTLNGNLPAPTATAPTPAIAFSGSAADYGPAGRIMIDGEEIDYSAIAQNASRCGTVPAPCFVGIVRGVDATAAVAHASGTPIAQYQCTVQSQGGVPSVTAPKALRTLTAGVQLQEGWAVGSEESALEGGTTYQSLLQWQGNTWATVAPPAPIAAGASLNAVTCLSYADCWAVGSADLEAVVYGINRFVAPVATALHWNGQSWAQVAVPNAVANHDLDAVACAAYDDCWMVGSFTQTKKKRWTLLYWNGAFTAILPDQVLAAPGSARTLPNKKYEQYDIDGVACASASQCWAVGSLGLASSGSGLNPVLLLEWNGVQWTFAASELPAAVVGGGYDLDAITCLAQGCWAVGSFGARVPVAVYWDAAAGTWTANSPTQGGDLESIACVTVSDCWAGGSWSNGRPTLEHWNGVAWSDQTPPAAVSDIDSISCVNAGDCWAVGSLWQPSGGSELQLLHYDGLTGTWSNLSGDIAIPPGGDAEDLEGIYIVGAHSAPQAGWQEIFP